MFRFLDENKAKRIKKNHFKSSLLEIPSNPIIVSNADPLHYFWNKNRGIRKLKRNNSSINSIFKRDNKLMKEESKKMLSKVIKEWSEQK